MPPPLPESESEGSDIEIQQQNQTPEQTNNVESSASSARKMSRGRPNKIQEISDDDKEVLAVEKEDEEEDEEEEEEEEDVYTVESIKNHMFDDNGLIHFQVKWEGYSKASDMTWEPESNLETALELVEEYYNTLGGREFVHDQATAELKKLQEKTPRKRGRASTGAAPAPKGKKGKTEQHPGSMTPPVAMKEFKPPSGSWEEEVKAIDACEGTDGEVSVYLTWRNGHKTQHPLETVYKRCPQKMLKFYESHLSFPPAKKQVKDQTNVKAESSNREQTPPRRGRPKKALK